MCYAVSSEGNVKQYRVVCCVVIGKGRRRSEQRGGVRKCKGKAESILAVWCFAKELRSRVRKCKGKAKRCLALVKQGEEKLRKSMVGRCNGIA